MTFTTQRLTGSRVLVRGTDISGTQGETVLNSGQWDELNQRSDFDQAQEAFDKAVEDFFAPLEAAAEKLTKSLERPTDSIGYVVLQEATPGVPAQAEHLVKLSHDSVVLRIIESGNTDRLVWIAGNLEVTEAPAPAASPVVADDTLV